jgi:serine/threonine protein kinase
MSYFTSDEFIPTDDQILDGRYKIENKLGTGGFATVWLATDIVTKIKYALKILKIQKKDKDVRNEVRFVSKFCHDNIIKLIDKFIFYDNKLTSTKYECVVYELCDTTLLDCIEVGNLSLMKIKTAMIHIFKGLDAIHSKKIIHSDIKPENILLSGNIFKIADFGLAEWEYCSTSNTTGTRYYRPPEMLLGINATIATDIWAAGCILFELMTGEILFYPRTYESWGISSVEDHLAQIVELIGDIPQWMKNGNQARKYIRSNGEFRNVPKIVHWPLDKLMKDKYKIFDDDCVDLLSKILCIDPEKRLTAKQCLEHKWLV